MRGRDCWDVVDLISANTTYTLDLFIGTIDDIDLEVPSVTGDLEVPSHISLTLNWEVAEAHISSADSEMLDTGVGGDVKDNILDTLFKVSLGLP